MNNPDNKIHEEFKEQFEDLQKRINDLKELTGNRESIIRDLVNLEKEAQTLKSRLFVKTESWKKVLISRHPQRPYTLDYIKYMTTFFYELHGDRLFRDDKAIVAGIGKIDELTVIIIGHQKGRDTKERQYRNFGMPHPEGYRKALRIMKLGEKFNLPVVNIIDTPGAFPGIGAEERGIAESIARNLLEMAMLKVPIIVAVIGEGGSGGALGIGVGDRILVMENAYYSVISPEGCASILFKDQEKTPEVSDMLKLTAGSLKNLGVIDRIVQEPEGGAHTDPQKAALILKKEILSCLDELVHLPSNELVKMRGEKFLAMGVFDETIDKQ